MPVIITIRYTESYIIVRCCVRVYVYDYMYVHAVGNGRQWPLFHINGVRHAERIHTDDDENVTLDLGVCPYHNGTIVMCS